MKPILFSSTGLLFLLAAAPALALTSTWDGGGANNTLTNATNWVGDIAPVSDLLNTDLIFAGVVRLAPDVPNGAIAVKSVTFNNTAGAFSLTGFTLTVGSGGITNNDLDTQTFGGNVTASGSQTINAASGALVFNAQLSIIAGSNVTLSGSNAVTIGSFGLGTGTLTKGNPGALTINGSTGFSISADLLLNAGTTTLAAGNSHSVNNTGSISVGAGAILNINENVFLNGLMTQTGTVNIVAGKTLRMQNGGDFSSADNYTITGGNVTVNGAGSTFTVPAGALEISGGSTLAVQSGGAISSLFIDVGITTSGTLTVDGSGSTASPGGSSFWGSGGGSATVTFSNNASGSMPGVNMARDAGSSASVQILSGADITNTSSLSVGNTTGAGASGTLLVSGAGTTWQQTGGSINIGAASGGAGTLTVGNGAVFTAPTSALTIGANGTLNLDGGTLSVGGAFTNNGTFNFTSGALSLLGSNNLTIGTGGLLGANLTLLSDRSLTVAGTTTVDAFRTLTLDGGTLSTGALTNNGTVDFQKGTLGITGAGGFNIGTGALGGNITLGTGANLAVTGTTTLATGALLRVNGGSFSGGNITNDGTLDHRDGALNFTGTLTNSAAGRLFVSGIAAPAGAISNTGRVTLQNGIGILGGAGTLTNTGLLTGDGTIARPVTNSTAGIIRGEAGKVLSFTGTFATNTGTLSLLGGMIEFAGSITNAASGFISGDGLLVTGGLTNSGTAAFIGDTGLFGDVTNASGGRIVTSGGAVTVLYDELVHNGAEIRTGTGSRTVILGAATGAGPYTGTGLVQFEGDLRPGNSPATVNFGGDVALSSTTALTMEIGGLTKGTQYDSLTITGSLTADGTLTLTLVNGFTPLAGHTFDLFDAAATTGAFTTLNLPALTAGLVWDTTQLYTTGTISVIAEGLTFAQWAATVLGDPAATPNGDHDFDGFDNATEFALGLFPPQPGTVLPNGGFHTYVDGESLRVLFTRPLDRTGVTLKVQASSDLTTWDDLATSVNSAPFTGPGFISENRAHPLPEPGLVEVRDTLTTSLAPRRQIRLRVTLTP